MKSSLVFTVKQCADRSLLLKARTLKESSTEHATQVESCRGWKQQATSNVPYVPADRGLSFRKVKNSPAFPERSEMFTIQNLAAPVKVQTFTGQNEPRNDRFLLLFVGIEGKVGGSVGGFEGSVGHHSWAIISSSSFFGVSSPAKDTKKAAA